MNKNLLHLGTLLIVGWLVFAIIKIIDTNSISKRPREINTFISACSGVDLTSEQEYNIAVATCKGRIAGYVIGQNAAVELNKLYVKDAYPDHHIESMPNIWCVPSSMSDNDMLNTVVKWIEDHPAEVTSTRSNYDDVMYSLVLTTKAFISTYPCSHPLSQS